MACILIWLEGGPPTMDMWDLKPRSRYQGPFRAIETAGDGQICEHLPRTAKVMDKLSIVRSMSTRDGDHDQAKYYMLTSFMPYSSVVHPSFGAVVSHALASRREDLQLPGFVSINGECGGAGFLGLEHEPFVVNADGAFWRTMKPTVSSEQLEQRQPLLDLVDETFQQERGETLTHQVAAQRKLLRMATSEQLSAFRVDDEELRVRAAFGHNEFGRGLIMARRLVQQGVPFVSVTFPHSFDIQRDMYRMLRHQHFPKLDQGVAALVEDLNERGLWEDTVLVITGDSGRVHRGHDRSIRWPRSWSLVIGGGGLKGGIAVGATDAQGTRVVTQPFSPSDLWATVAHALGIPLDTIHVAPNGRPFPIANGGSPISALIE